MAVDHSHLQHLTIWNSLPQPMVIISHARGHLRVSRFTRRTTEKRETARSLVPPSVCHQYGISAIDRFSDVIWLGNQWWRRQMSAVF